MTDFIPDAHTLFIVEHGVEVGKPWIRRELLIINEFIKDVP